MPDDAVQVVLGVVEDEPAATALAQLLLGREQALELGLERIAELVGIPLPVPAGGQVQDPRPVLPAQQNELVAVPPFLWGAADSLLSSGRFSGGEEESLGKPTSF